MATDALITPGGEEHILNPFESAFTILKELRMEVKELREALKLEQEQRQREVGQLKEELGSLKAELDREEVETGTTLQKLNGNLIAQTTQTKGELDELRATQNASISKLRTFLEDEVRKFAHTHQDMLAKMEAEAMQRKADNDCFIRELTAQTKKTQDTTSDLNHKVSDISQDLMNIVAQMLKASAAWQDSKLEKLKCLAGSSPEQIALMSMSS